MPRGKARPLKQIFQIALEAAKAFGFPRVEVSIPDGSTVVFGKGEELTAEDLRSAAYALGRLLGRVDVEDILDVIFRDFCIGK